MSPVGCLAFKASEASIKRLVGSTPTSSANSLGDFDHRARTAFDNSTDGLKR